MMLGRTRHRHTQNVSPHQNMAKRAERAVGYRRTMPPPASSILWGTSGQEPQITRIPQIDAVVKTLHATSLPPKQRFPTESLRTRFVLLLFKCPLVYQKNCCQSNVAACSYHRVTTHLQISQKYATMAGIKSNIYQR
jgi:hypothetical protein